MAELLLKHRLEVLGLKGFTITSAGIKAKKGDVINPKSAQVLEENGIASEGFTSTKLTDKIVREAFAIVTMTESQKDFLTDMRWNALRKVGEEAEENNVHSFYEISGYEVLDPYGKDMECYRYVYSLLSAGMDCLIDKLHLRQHAYVPKTKPKTSGEPKKRGRPKKPVEEGETTAPKKRGRPKKEKEALPLFAYIETGEIV
jgi:protein-tyrosine-phosphatase